jgi:thiamine-phosphate pyrophosphorylase
MKKLNLHAEKGLYLVIDPSDKEEKELFETLEKLFAFPLAAVQIWDHFGEDQNPEKFTDKVLELASPYAFPVLVNNRWDLLRNCNVDGIHLDAIPADLSLISESLSKKYLLGLTVNNDLDQIRKADKLGFGYVSFCSVYPTKTTQYCDLVSFDAIKKASEITKAPVFLAGGIKPRHLTELQQLPHSGIALISGVMKEKDPVKALEKYYHSLQKEIP